MKPYIRNKANRNKEIDTIKRKILIWAKKLKAVNIMGGKCEICGELKLWNLCFHHKNKEDKEEDINYLRSSKVRFSELMVELKKCQLVCQNCHREIHKLQDNINKRQRLNKKLCLEFKQTNNCEICGYNKCDTSLEFHHKDSNTKDTKISKFVYNHTWKELSDITEDAKKELDKCIVVCRNCHQTIHQDMNFIETYWDDIIFKSINLAEKNIVDAKQVIRLGKEGFDKFEIAKKLNCSHIRVWEILKSNNLTTPKHIVDKKIIIDLFKKGDKICDITRKTKFSKSSVLKVIKEYKNENHPCPNQYHPE
jgi:Mor family transcriptional regulator